MNKQTFLSQLNDTLSKFPEGLTASDLKSLLPNGGPNAVSAALYELKRVGAIKVIGKEDCAIRGKIRTVSIYASTGKSYTAKPKPMRRATPTNAGLQARLDAVNSRIRELEAWKADAEARFPELKIKPAAQHMTFGIIKNAPPPEPVARGGWGDRPRAYNFPDMEVGDCFVAPDNMGVYKNGNSRRALSIKSSSRGYRKKYNLEAKFTIRKMDGFIRCWRIA